MQLARFIMADAITPPVAGCVVDLAEYAHPAARAAALEDLAGQSGPLAVIVPGDANAQEIRTAVRSGPKAIVVNDTESVAQLQGAAAALDEIGAAVGLVARITTGRGLAVAGELAAAHARVAGLWYAMSDLVVDFEDEPPMPFYYDGGETRLAAPAWSRSLLLTVTRSVGIELWGQLDLSFASERKRADRERAARLGRLSGFDVLVTRFPLARSLNAVGTN